MGGKYTRRWGGRPPRMHRPQVRREAFSGCWLPVRGEKFEPWTGYRDSRRPGEPGGVHGIPRQRFRRKVVRAEYLRPGVLAQDRAAAGRFELGDCLELSRQPARDERRSSDLGGERCAVCRRTGCIHAYPTDARRSTASWSVVAIGRENVCSCRTCPRSAMVPRSTAPLSVDQPSRP